MTGVKMAKQEIKTLERELDDQIYIYQRNRTSMTDIQVAQCLAYLAKLTNGLIEAHLTKMVAEGK